MKSKVYFLIYFCLLQSLCAQDWQVQFRDGVSSYQAGKHQEAIQLLSSAKSKAVDYIGTSNINYFYIVTILGRAYESNLQLKEAEKEFAEAYQIAKKAFPNNEEGYLLLSAHNLGKNYYLQQNYPEAEKYTQEAYQFIKNNPQHQEYTSVCHTLAAIYKEEEKFNDAEKLFQEVYKATSPQESLYFNALNGLAVVRFKKGKIREAEETFLQLLEASEKRFGKDENYAIYTHNIGGFYKEIHQTLKAEKYLKEALAIREKFLGKKHPDYALTSSYLGYVYQDLGKWQEAEKLFEEAKKIYQELNLKQDYVLATNNLASLKEAQGFYKQAEALYQEALEICEKLLGKENSTYAMLSGNLAGLYYKQGLFAKAEPLFQRALQLNEKVYGKNSLQYQQSAMNYATFKLQKGEINTAEKGLLQTAQYFEKTTGKESLAYITALQNLALVDFQKENFLQAEEKYFQALKLCEQAVGKNSENYITLLNNFAQLYTILGNFEKALQLYQQVFELASKIWSENHIHYAIALRNVAYIYTLMGNHTEAEKLCVQSLRIVQQNYGENNPEYLVCLNNLTSINFYQKNYKNLLINLEKAQSISENVHGKEHPITATLLNNLALAYIENGDYAKASNLLVKTLSIKEKIFGKEHQEYLTAEQNLAWLLSLQNKLPEAEKHYKSVVNKQIERIFKVFPMLSESEKMAFVNQQKVFFINYFDFCFDYAPQKPSILGDMLDFRMITKGMVAEVTQNLQRKALKLNNPQVTQLYKDWLGKKNEYLKLINAPSSEKSATEIAKVSDELNLLEKELSKKVDVQGKKHKIYSWKEIQKKLKNDEVAIEVIRTFAKNSANPKKIDTSYAFLLISPETTQAPELLFVPNASLLETELLALYSNTIETRRTQFYKELYDSFWGNVLKQSKVWQKANCKKIYFSPDGVYHKVNIATLYDESKKQFLGEFLQIYQLSNLKKLLEEENPNTTSTKTAFLFGYPDYQGTSSQEAKEANRSFSTSVSAKEKQKLSRFLDFENVSYLPGTKKETDEIAKILQSNGVKTTLLQEKNANETAIKNLQNPSILHIATHGFFLEDVPLEEESRGAFGKMQEIAKNPLLRAGLLLANCSQSLKNENLTAQQEDGILTAYEVAQMNLQNTELVVLSACETGLGEIQNGEGVFGLQRAFLQAGAQNLIISLWKVDDQATQEFMNLLYENWQNKKMSLQGSFFEAQKAIKQKYTHPKYWGAFVMVK
ncbi:MAG: hypothetical protein OHK0045_24610 [Raineya sp.]